MTAARPLATPPTVERSLLQLLPAVPARPLPKRLNPRRMPLGYRMRRLGGRVQRLVYGPRVDRAFVLLMVAVTAAAVCLLLGLDATYGPDTTAVSR